MTLRILGLAKSYGSKRVLEGVDVTFEAGRIHALLGPNGSGKSTLIACLGGAVAPDHGTIEVRGEPLNALTPRRALAAGVSVIYQHFSLVRTLSVEDNIFLGEEKTVKRRIDHTAQRAEVDALLARFNRPIRPQQIVGNLSVGDRQLVEIAKALRRRPAVLILDEPTAALGEAEARQLGDHLVSLKSENIAVIYVTHLMEEVFAIADDVTVLRDGHVALSAVVGDVTRGDLVRAISPNHVPTIRRDAKPATETVLRAKNIRVGGVGPISLDVRRGEVVALFGLLGSGRTEVVEGLYGAQRITGGQVEVDGESGATTPARSLRKGIALVAGDRLAQGVFDKLAARDNMLLPHMSRLGKGPLRSRRREAATIDTVADRTRLHPKSIGALAWTFSGGNQQKLMVGRWLADSDRLRLLLLDEPTQGIDVGARADLYELLRSLAIEDRKAVLFTSSDPAEVMALADRTYVIRRGQVVAELPHWDCTEAGLLRLAHGTDEGSPDE